MDREQALNGAVLISYTCLCRRCSYYVLCLHNPAQTHRQTFSVCHCFSIFLAVSPLRLCVLAVRPVDLFIGDCRVHGVTMGYIWTHCFGGVWCKHVCMYASKQAETLPIHLRVSSCTTRPNDA